MEGFIVILAIVILILWVAAAMEFQHIAQEKGYDKSRYFWWSLLSPFGMLMVIALPNTGNQTETAPVQSDELPEL